MRFGGFIRTFTLTAAVLAILLFALPNFIVLSDSPIFITRHSLPQEGAGKYNERPTLIVLGAGVRRKELSGMLRCRMLKAIEIYQQQPASKVLLSGDGTDPHYNETNAMRQFALANAIGADHLLTDPLGFSTYDSLRRAFEVFGVRSAIIVTQDFHLSRALWIARSFGMKADGIACEKNSSGFFYHLREIPARAKDVFLRWFDVAPRSNRDDVF